MTNTILIPCTKRETLVLEDTTIPITSLNYTATNRKKQIELLDLNIKLTTWYFAHNITAQANQRTYNAKLSELLDFKPQYHTVRGSGNYRHAVWGFEYGDVGGIIYHSKKGISLQVGSKTNVDWAIELLTHLHSKLC